MINVSKFVKDHIPLCVCTFGIAVLGYLGYHAVQWIISKCSKTEKIDHIAQKTIGSTLPHKVSPSNNYIANPQIFPLTPMTASRQYQEVQVHKIALRLKSESQKNVAATKIQIAYRGHTARLPARKLRNEKLEEQREAAAIRIQSICRRHLAKTKLKDLRKEKLEQQEVSATKIQSIFRDYKARLKLKQLQSARSKSVTIIDAKDAGMNWHEVRLAINTIAKNELKDDEGWVSAADYVKEEYFNGTSIAPGLSSPETILLAKASEKIIGFLITAKRKEKGFWSSPPDTGYVAYLAVDSKIKKSGVGTKLMLAAMNKTKQLGKRYLTLEYIAKGLKVDEIRGKAKIGFYNSFSTKFGIPMKEKGNTCVTRQLHVHPYYDLQGVDFSSIKQIA
jgi:ribosomal protein S18 acetylase RimI-like enzyme